MSLKDTIRGARDEAAASGNPFERSKATAEDEAPQEVARTKRGTARRSAASAKPSREAAAGVRVVSSSGKTTKGTAQMTKEERKQERKKEREKEDQRYSLTQAYLEEDEEYKKARKRWWAFLIGGVAFMAIALILYGRVTSTQTSPESPMGIAAVISMVLAYAVVIGGLVYDFTKIRPLRKEAEKRAQSMSDKRLKARLVEKAEKEEAEKAARKAKRGKK